MMLAILREIQHLWEEEGESDPGIADAARLIGEAMEGVSTEGDLIPGAPPSVVWEEGMVWLKCSPPPPHMRPSAQAVASQCPKLATLADLLLREDVFAALPWQSQAMLSDDFTRGPIQLKQVWLEFWLEKPLEFWLEIPYIKMILKNWAF